MSCNHQNKTEIITKELIHYGKYICSNPECKKFLGWMKDPKIDMILKNRQQTIRKILKKVKLTEKNREFLLNICELRHLSPKQELYYNNLIAKLPKQ